MTNYLRQLGHSLRARTTTPSNYAEYQRWLADRGDAKLRQEYDLGPESVVLDVGGYQGQWASDIFSRYCCRIHVFEPIPDLADGISLRFTRNPKITVHRFGLAARSMSARITVDSDASSLLTTGKASESVELRSAEDVFGGLDLMEVDLMKVNIEGAEYELINHMIDAGLMGRVRNLQIQFHAFVDDSEVQMHAIQMRLQRTHEPTYQYRFVWENWRRK